MSQLQTNLTNLQAILNNINNLPEASTGVKLPELNNEGSASELFSGKELINQNGNIVTGTFSLDSELNTQDNLIVQIQTALSNKATGVVLPELTNPGTAENLKEGYQLIDSNGNIIVGTHVCEDGGSVGNIKYFIVQNNLPDILAINGVLCEPGNSTNIPYDEINYAPSSFIIPNLIEYSFDAGYTEILKNENGEFYEESGTAGIRYMVDENMMCIFGGLFNFIPSEYIVDNTITFYVEE